MNTIDYLHQVPLFNLLAGEEKRTLASYMRTERYRMGQTIVSEDEPAEAFYVIVSGHARKIGLSDQGMEKNLGLLGPGEHFGEHGLFSKANSPLLIRASTDLEVLRLDRERFMALLQEHPELDNYVRNYISSEALNAFLKNNTVFTHVDASAIRSLLDHLEIRSYAAGETLVEEGEIGDAFYILKEGTAAVEKGADRAVVNRLYPGDFFGELALLADTPRQATVRAAVAVTAFRLAKSDFESLTVRFPVILASIRRISAHYSTSAMPDSPVVDEAAAEDRGTEEAIRPITESRPHMLRGGLKLRFGKKYPALMQQNEMDCGPTCLTMIARYYGMKASVNRMRERCNVGVEGTSMLSLTETGEALGFEAKGLKLTAAQLQDLDAPFIAHWDGNHYIVVYAIEGERATVADPAVGYVDTIPLSAFGEHWSGLVITLTPTERLAPLNDEESLFRRYAETFKPYRQLLFSALALSIVLELVLLAFPVMTQQIFDRVLEGNELSLLNVLLLAMLAMAGLSTVGIAVRQLLLGKLAYRIDRAMLDRFYRHLFRLPYTYFTKRTSGDIITRVYENEKVRQLLTNHGISLVLDVLTLFVYGGLMFYYHPPLALIALSVMPLYAALYAYILPRMRRNFRKQMLAEGESQTQIVEAVGAIATVKGLAMEHSVRRRLMEKLSKQLSLRFEGNKQQTWLTAGSTALQSLSNLVLLYFGARFVMSGGLSVGELVAFTVLFASFMHALEAISHVSGELSEARISMERLNDVYESTPEHEERSKLRTLPSIRGHIRLENVSFRYSSGGKMILQNLNVEIQPGQTVALVGRSGSGKSTIANLLLKLLTPTSGAIYIDGYPLQGVHAASIRRQVGVVQQETVIFRGSVRDNIALAGTEHPFEEVERAARLAGAHEFIEALPLGYGTMIGEGGIRLSGGQRQRIVIARALLSNPRILVFDEATSALDTESERIIQNNMEAMLHGRTTLVIAHRLSTIRNADLILVLDEGRIVESGTHDELLNRKGMYHYLVHQQSL
ncbi:ATP-binding cassette subfamily B protein [Paenibacillus phyllosphaerae]|uniref:ATP-binding cassette subfamily B protein n=1 Tax=Paenibacillus phyllosphaerae TaxID=274593 RepID=A0A7W5AU84_9BACL|nr:peptidase domain-containing ABC transporter [Paenibacillus phyllosphaerae]MBB3108654.1 ATP-binding cassette subfamily B protein [Paenibacillus phyllosphaerae]